jgi:hypothetical protein
VGLDELVRALRRFLTDHFVPVWGTPARLVKARGFAPGAWAIGIFESEKDAADDGYHDLTPGGLPFARVYLRNIESDRASLSATLSHELAEMLVDPTVNLVAGRSDRVMYDFEVADPVEEESFPVDGLPMTDFVYPAWFEGWRKARSTRFDHLGRLHRPFQIMRTGYARKFRGGQWREVWGSHRKAARFRGDARAGERRDLRTGRPRRISVPRRRSRA